MILSKTSIGFRFALLGVLCVFTGTQAGPLLGQVMVPSFETCADPMIANCRGNNDIILMQPLDDETHNLTVSSEPLQVFFDYFNMSWPWLLGVASGIAVLQAVWGGILIMTSLDHDGGKEKIQWAVGGMVIIALAGFILRFLNSMFYA